MNDPFLKGILSGSQAPLVNGTSWVAIVPIGNYGRHTEIKSQILNSANDFNLFFANNYPKNTFADSYTDIELSEAWAMKYARQNGVNKYYLIRISDDLTDQGNPGTYTRTDEEKKIMLDYSDLNKSRSLVLQIGGEPDTYITIRKVYINDSPPPKPRISFISCEGRKEKPCVEKDGKISLSWNCKGCPGQILFAISARGYGGNNDKYSKEVSNTSISLDLKRGKYKITVKANGVTPAVTYYQIKGSGAGVLIFMLFVIAAIIGAYMYRKRIRDKKRKTLDNTESKSLLEEL